MGVVIDSKQRFSENEWQALLLQRKPFIFISHKLHCLQKSLVSHLDLGGARLGGLVFTLLKTKPDGSESFRFIAGHDRDKIDNILSNRALFQRLAPLVMGNSGQSPGIIEYYRDQIARGESADALDFATGVFHLTFRFHVPVHAFDIGLIHSAHRKSPQKAYHAVLRPDLPTGLGNLPYVQIEGGSPLPQISDHFFPHFNEYQEFYQDWLNTVKGWAAAHEGNRYVHHLYFPVYDSTLPDHGALRGYLGVFLSDAEDVQKVKAYFANRDALFGINDAFLKGVQNNIVSNYNRNGQIPDPIIYWKSKIKSLHQWGKIEFEKAVDNRSLYSIKDNALKISIPQLLSRKEISAYVDDAVLHNHQDQVLSIQIPQGIIPKPSCNIESPYLNKRFREICNLLDEILRTRYSLMTAAKSAVAAVMARNQSHNLGSHVFARLTSSDLTELLEDNSFKMQAFLSFLRTRMDFIADVCTATPAVETSMRIYRDIMGYFNPVGDDRENYSWQEILFDFISGIDPLNSETINFSYFQKGQEVNLSNFENDLVFASPNGLLGTHAIYVILENIIRNSAKHKFNPEKSKELNIVFEMLDICKENGLIEIIVYDKLKNANEKISIDNKAVALIDFINQIIEKPILNEKGELRSEGWGILEMKICAAYLRRVAPELIDTGMPEEYPLLEAVDVDGNLGYRFYLPTPNEALIVDPKNSIPEKDELNECLKISGSQIVDVAEFKRLLYKNVQHFFLVLVNPTAEILELVNKNRTALPTRILTTDPNFEQYPHIPYWLLNLSIENNMDVSNPMMSNLWHSWIKHKNPKAMLFIRPENSQVLDNWEYDNICQASTKVESVLSVNSDKQYIVFDRHGMVFKNDPPSLKKLIEKQKIIYYEPVEYNQPTCFIIENSAAKEHFAPIRMFKMLEAGLSKIVLLDERIQKAINHKFDHLTKRQVNDILKDMNIWLPEKGYIDLDAPNVYCHLLKEWLADHLADTTFLVVHLGILEKIYKEDINKMRAALEKYEERYPNLTVVIISGRGLPPEVRKLKTRFIQYSQLAWYTSEERSKYHLCKVLSASRRALSL